MIKHIQFIGKILILSVFILLIVYISVDIKSEDVVLNDSIEVEIQGEVKNPGVYTLDNGSTYKDRFERALPLDDSDISSYS